ncbi:MAG: class I SAM-dependent methyltransferase [Thermoleophilia bacterium]
MISEKFLNAISEYLAPLKGTYIYDAICRDYLEKTGTTSKTYADWLRRVIPFLVKQYKLPANPRIIDFGCGTGELTTLMNCLGYSAVGVDVHETHLKLARILAEENGLPDSTFVLSSEQCLPFDDNSFDIITLFVVLEHLNDNVMNQILPEIWRVCRGVVYILVPNKLQLTDNHTGLAFVPWMPHWIASAYIKLRGKKYQYYISNDGSWDVHYRTLSQIQAALSKQKFTVGHLPDELVFPSLTVARPIHKIGKHFSLFKKNVILGLPIPYRTLIKLGCPKEYFYPYLNLICRPNK